MTEESKRVVLHSILVGFHHQKGLTIEACYPPLDGKGDAGNIIDISNLPPEWKNLTNLAVPDGAHNVTEQSGDSCYFLLPGTNESKFHAVYGVCCFSQIDVSQINQKLKDVTRNTVLKGVCIISRLPFFGHIRKNLESITMAYFQELKIVDDTFTSANWLKKTYHQINSGFLGKSLENVDLFQDYFCTQFMEEYKFYVLQLIKCILLEKKILFYTAKNSLPMCNDILTLISLFPDCIETGLFNAASNAKNFNIYSENEKNADTNKKTSIESERLEAGDTEKFSDTAEYAFQYKNSPIMIKWLENDKCPPLEEDSLFGFPLDIFPVNTYLLPYCSLTCYDDIKDKPHVAGVTNAMVKLKNHYDVLVEIKDNGPIVTFKNKELERLTSLTSADKKFINNLLLLCKQMITERKQVSNQCDEWIRRQFKCYFLSLMGVVVRNDFEYFNDFNSNFIKYWKLTHNFSVWESQPWPILLHINPEHIYHNELSYVPEFLKTAKDKFTESIKASDIAGQAGLYAGQLWSSLKSAANSNK